MDWQDDADRKEETLAIIADLLGFSWTGKLSNNVIIYCFESKSKIFTQENQYVLHSFWIENDKFVSRAEGKTASVVYHHRAGKRIGIQ